MSNERELKLLPLREINRNQLLRVLSDNGYKIEGEIRRQKQEDTYYDTPDKELYNNNRSLRIRNVEGKTYITYKVPTSSVQAYTERKEFEVEIPEEYISQNGKVELPDAINFLRQKYPDLELPENLDVAAKVNNNRNKINILITHGDIVESPYNYMNLNKLREKGFNYIALGHIHKQDTENKKIVYPGSLISLGFDELGSHGMIARRNRRRNKRNYNTICISRWKTIPRNRSRYKWYFFKRRTNRENKWHVFWEEQIHKNNISRK